MPRDEFGGLQDQFGDGADLDGAQFLNLGPTVADSNAARKDYVDGVVATVAATVTTADSRIDAAEGRLTALEATAPVVVNAALGGVAFDIVVDHNTVSMGTVTFKIHNVALGIHELLLVKTDTSAADIIASVGVGGTWDETGQDIRFDTDNLTGGHYARADVVLEPGHFVLICNEPGHVHLGMVIDFTVTMLTGATANAIAGR